MIMGGIFTVLNLWLLEEQGETILGWKLESVEKTSKFSQDVVRTWVYVTVYLEITKLCQASETDVSFNSIYKL